MPDTLPVHLNRQERHSLEVPATFETDDSFVVGVRNHGEASRVHVHLDGTLADVATIDETNHYVRANETVEIPIAVREGGTVHGKLKLVSGYGAVTRWVDVRITEQEDTGVEVDEDLATPQPAEEPVAEQSIFETLSARPAVPVLALGGVAVLVAVTAAVAFRNTAALVGALAVVVAAVGAAALVLR